MGSGTCVGAYIYSSPQQLYAQALEHLTAQPRDQQHNTTTLRRYPPQLIMSALSVRLVRPTTVLAGVAIGGASYAFVRNVHADTGAPAKVFGRGPAFVSLSLESSEQVNHNTKLLRFKLPNESDVSGLSLTCEYLWGTSQVLYADIVTAAVLTASWPKGSWTPVARPYTPVSSSDETGKLELLVKHYPSGKQSTHLHSLKPGDSLLFAAALRSHQWKPNSVPHVTLIAGGSGVTPIYQLARGILSNPEDKTKVTLVYAANTDEDILLKKEFDDFQKEFPGRFEAVYAVSQPAGGSTIRKGRVSKELLAEVTQSKDGNVFMCGPPAMEAALKGDRKTKGILEELGYRKDQIHSF